LVYLSTWDIGQQISHLDIALAHTIDALYTDSTPSSPA
jgi:pterin-4a-carbinolamine dehydratase